MNKRFDRIMVAVVVIGFLAALPLLWHRHQLEEASRTVEIVMDYDDLQGLARKAGADPGQLLDMFRQAGVTTLAVYDTTLKKLHDNGDVTVLTGADVLRTGGYSLPQKQTADGNYDREVVRRTADITRLAGWLIPAVETGGIDLADVIVVGHDPNSFSEAVEDLRLRLGEERVTVLLGAPVSTVLVKGDLTELLKMNLGFSSREISAVNSHGFMVLPRPTNYSLVDRSKIDRTFARIDRAGQLSGIMFTGTEVLGYPDLIDYTAEQLNRRGITLGLIEHPVQYQFVRQDGLFQLVAEVGYRAARAYAIPKDEQPKMELWQAVHRWTLSDQERDIRINLLRTFEKPLPGQTLVQTNISYVSQVRQKLEDEGFAVGRAGRFSDWLPESSYGRKEANYRGFPRYMTVLCIWGTIAGGLIMIRQLVPVSRRLLYGLGAVLAVGGLLSQTSDGLWLLARQAAALTAAIVFPVLAITVAIDRWSCGENRGKSLTSTVFRAIGYLCLTVMISGVGAALLAAVLTDVRFLLEIDTYRGVKLTFILPVILIVLVYLSRYNLVSGCTVTGWQGLGRRMLEIMRLPVTIGSLAVLSVAGLAMLFMVLRSGHTEGAPVPALEVKMRVALEYLTYARPREKEFLIGHPAFLMSFAFLYWQWPRWLHFAAMVGAVIGQGSMVETFAHMRTPVMMSAVRGIDGLVGGVLVGVIMIAVVCAVRRSAGYYRCNVSADSGGGGLK